MDVTSLDRGFAAAFWAALVGGSVLLAAYFVPLPAAFLVGGWILLLASVLAAFALAVIGSRREGVGVARTFVRGLRTAVGWIIAFLP